MTKMFKQALLGTAAAIAMGSFAGSAHAGLVSFTWDPNQAGAPSGTEIGNTSGGGLQANNANVADFAYASIVTGGANSGQFTENGILQVTLFLNGPFSSQVSQTGLGSTYNLYIDYTVTGTLNNWPGAGNPLNNSYTGSISSLSYSFIIDPNGKDTITDTGSSFALTDPGSNDVTLATGGETGGQNSVDLDQGTPTAHSTATWNPTGTDSGFFVAPPPGSYVDFDLQAAFTNTSGTSSLSPGDPTVLKIDGGGGNFDFVQVPEPASLSIFGAALLGLGFASKRRRKS